jgi:S-formylglutathione hydrolase FrmB
MQRFSSFIPHLVALLAALLSGVLFFNTTILSSFISMIISVGLDPLRAQLIAALLITAGAALIGAVVGRRKLGALLGAGVVFCFGYLIGFIQLELQLVHDPGGNVEPLNSSALVHTSAVVMALAVLSAFFGAAVGVALTEVLFEPPYRLARHIWQRSKYPHQRHASASVQKEGIDSRVSAARAVKEGIGSWLGVAMMVIVLVFASGSGDLFLYSPDIGLHTLPTIHNQRGLPAHGTIVEDSVVSPALSGQKKPFLVYLPPSYNTAQGLTQRYPTLYLLHGSPGKESDWFTGGKADQSADTLIALGKIPELILILPDGNGRPGHTSEWGNSFDHQQNIETYVANDLVTYVDTKYRTLARASYRGIGGLSMGGFGAMNIALHHPDVFGFVIALGGYYRAEGGIWGKNAAYMRENSPIDVLPSDRRAWRLHMYIGAATKDQPYFTYAKQFVQELDHLHLPYQLDVQSGYHSWKVWQTQIYTALIWLHWGNEP